MKVVIDSNVLLNAVFPGSKNYWIRKALEQQQLTLCLTTDILNEYEEVLGDFYDPTTADLFLSALEVLPNLIQVRKYYFWQLIPEDPDDEKFADCAVAVGADYLVTNDRHFNPIKKIPFPKINIVNETEFRQIFEEKVLHL